MAEKLRLLAKLLKRIACSNCGKDELTHRSFANQCSDFGRTKGAQIDLIVRGACMLPAGLPGKTDNIRVRSIIGRFLEHSRVFFFEAGDVQDIYLSSADWMSRNMTRRIELAWPVLDLALRQRLVDECLLAYLHDTRNAWTLESNGSYVRVDKKAIKRKVRRHCS